MTRTAKYSFVTWGVNDSYGVLDADGPSAQLRIGLSVESMLQQNRDVEVIVVDPGPDSDVVLPSEVRVLKVPYAQHKAKFPTCRYNGAFLWNYGIRNATGEYIIACTSDDFFTKGFMDVVETVLSEDTLIICSKHYATTLPVHQGLTYWKRASMLPMREAAAVLDDTLTHNEYSFPHDGFASGIAETGHDMHMMHRRLWNACRGYDESMVGWGYMDIQLCTRIRSEGFDVINIGMYGAKMFHLDHLKPTPVLFNSWVNGDRFVVNGEDWGTL